jgi:hypothetical protein
MKVNVVARTGAGADHPYAYADRDIHCVTNTKQTKTN